MNGTQRLCGSPRGETMLPIEKEEQAERDVRLMRKLGLKLEMNIPCPA